MGLSLNPNRAPFPRSSQMKLNVTSAGANGPSSVLQSRPRRRHHHHGLPRADRQGRACVRRHCRPLGTARSSRPRAVVRWNAILSRCSVRSVCGWTLGLQWLVSVVGTLSAAYPSHRRTALRRHLREVYAAHACAPAEALRHHVTWFAYAHTLHREWSSTNRLRVLLAAASGACVSAQCCTAAAAAGLGARLPHLHRDCALFPCGYAVASLDDSE